MDYDPYHDFNGSQDANQEDDWLDDIKSLLDEEPGGSVRKDSSSDAQSFQAAPAFQVQPPAQPQFRQPPQPGFPMVQPQAPRGYPVPQNMPNFNLPNQQRPFPNADGFANAEVKPRKRSWTAVIVLSIVILLELAGIAGVVMAWMQWMQ